MTSKEIRHEIMVEVRNEVGNSSLRTYCISNILSGSVDEGKKELYLQALQKKKYILGCELQYRALAYVVRLKQNRSEQEKKFLEFAQKNEIV